MQISTLSSVTEKLILVTENPSVSCRPNWAGPAKSNFLLFLPVSKETIFGGVSCCGQCDQTFPSLSYDVEANMLACIYKDISTHIVIMILYHRVAAKCQSLSRIKRNGTPKVMSVFTLMLFESRS